MGFEVSCVIVSAQSGCRKRGMALASCFLIFIQSGIPTQGVVLRSDRVGSSCLSLPKLENPSDMPGILSAR